MIIVALKLITKKMILMIIVIINLKNPKKFDKVKK